MNKDRRITREELKTAIHEAYISIKDNKGGKNADYIPYLANVDKKRLIEAFSRSCSEQNDSPRIINDLLDAVSRFEREQSDDQTVVIIRRTED